jgi:hypothetical protein
MIGQSQKQGAAEVRICLVHSSDPPLLNISSHPNLRMGLTKR